MIKLKFIFVGADDNFLMSQRDFDDVKTRLYDVSVYTEWISNNKNELARIYNSRMDQSINPNTKKSDFDYIIFSHADVRFDPTSFISHLIEINGKYDLIGLAGTKKMNTSYSPLNWFTSSHEFPEQRYGHVVMTNDGRTEDCFYNRQHNPDVRDTEVACIDGLCMAVSRSLIERGFRFDTGIDDFNFYDTGASLKCILDYNGKVGVMVEKVEHTSVGKSILSESFRENEKKFRERWKFSKIKKN